MLCIHLVSESVVSCHPWYADTTILYRQHPIAKAQIAGVVTLVSKKGSKIIFYVDDGTAAVQCVLFATHMDGTPTLHEPPELGDLVLVSGKIGFGYRVDSFGTCRELRVRSVRTLTHADECAATWLETMRLHAEHYSKPIGDVIKHIADVDRMVPPLAPSAARLHGGTAADGDAAASVVHHRSLMAPAPASDAPVGDDRNEPFDALKDDLILSFVASLQRIAAEARASDEMTAQATLSELASQALCAGETVFAEVTRADAQAVPISQLLQEARFAGILPDVPDDDAKLQRAVAAAVRNLVSRAIVHASSSGTVTLIDNERDLVPAILRILAQPPPPPASSRATESAVWTMKSAFDALLTDPRFARVNWSRFGEIVNLAVVKGAVVLGGNKLYLESDPVPDEFPAAHSLIDPEPE